MIISMLVLRIQSKLSAHGSKTQNESSKSTDSELSTSTITEKYPLQEKNDSNLSNIKSQELSDEELLLKIKNRLKAITLIQNNFFKIEEIAEKYNLSKNVLFYDFFGFDQNDSELSPNFIEKTDFISKIDSIKAETDKIFKIIEKTVEESNFDNGKQKYIQTIPKALVAVKFKVPFFFVNIICDNLNSHKNSSDDTNKENSLFSGDFVDNLFEFCHEIFQHRNDIKKIIELLNESKNFNFEKKSDKTGAEETEKLDEKNLQQDNLESNDQD
ncbi:hypothetical protein BpHYR1_032293 [Brachionus plicatilis]|uniref:Uncharacterized protein n=1 Tax=Brachionus plicatilis TaxID=10195 RepID=A0A3M7Q577_BRAPC|nr:hypothetical protein BpHYR1_032293 [Brachionus plicatilis]